MEEKNADRVTDAYRAIRKLILFHRLSPGTPIIQARMAQELRHSRATLRAALQRLAQEGYVFERQLGTYSRFVVASLTVEDMQELFAIVGALEGVAVRQCTRLCEKERNELATRMQRLNEHALTMVESGDYEPEEYNRADTDFHQAFIDKATGARLLTQLDSIRPQVERYRDSYTARVAGRIRVMHAPEHQAIADAIRNGDPDLAQKAVEVHWRSGAGRLGEFIQKMGEQRGYAGA
ncbi:MAG: GntR family transcriptional regulator [Gemmatimonadota bacterium]|jgi:DNA-binding GntR family transcriptional regulator